MGGIDLMLGPLILLSGMLVGFALGEGTVNGLVGGKGRKTPLTQSLLEMSRRRSVTSRSQAPV
jgi:hypothetical protein